MSMSPGASVVTEILAQAPSEQVAESMLLGSSFEGGWGPSFGVGDQGHSYGPFQINLPYHPGVTAAQADDPKFATSYMLPAYEAGVASVPADEWQSNPELAAEQAAVAAERPARSYLDSYGQQALDTHWSDVQGAASGSTLPSTAGAGSTNAQLTSFLGVPSISDVKSLVFEALFVGAGIGLVVLGVYKTANPGKSLTQTVTGKAEQAGTALAAA